MCPLFDAYLSFIHCERGMLRYMRSHKSENAAFIAHEAQRLLSDEPRSIKISVNQATRVINTLNIKIFGLQSILFNEISPWLYLITH